MGEWLKRLGVPLVVAILFLMTVASMVGDRRALAEGGRELPWWQATILEVTAPIVRIVSAPFDGIRSFFESYVDLIGVRAESRRLRRRIGHALVTGAGPAVAGH